MKFSKLFKNKKKINKTSNEIICQKCKKEYASYIRTFDYEKLTDKYFYPPDEIIVSMLHCKNIYDKLIYPDFWVQLPKELILTKYPYKICENCYQIEKNFILNPWNEWKILN